MAKITIRRVYTGRANEPPTWESLLEIFDVVWGEDARALPIYPAVIGGVSAGWTDAEGVEHRAASLDEVAEAYRRYETASVQITGAIGDRPRCSLRYRPANASAAFKAEAPDANVADALIAAVQRVFPLPARYVFISYDTSEVGLALFVQKLIEARIAPGVSVFVAKRDIMPGANPLKVMLDDQLLNTEALVAICSRRSKGSPWLWWESSAVWARAGLVVPLFVDVEAGSFGGPLTLVCQGRRFHDPADLSTALRSVVEKVSPGRECPQLTPAEVVELNALRVEDESPLEILFEPSPPFVQDDFDPSVGSLRRVGVKNLTNHTLDDVEVSLANFEPQGAQFLPVRLRLMHDLPQPFRLHPGETQYADLVWYEAMGRYPNQLVLCYGVPGVPNMIPLRRYRIAVKAAARDVKARQRTFAVDVDEDGRLLLSPEAPHDVAAARDPETRRLLRQCRASRPKVKPKGTKKKAAPPRKVGSAATSHKAGRQKGRRKP